MRYIVTDTQEAAENLQKQKFEFEIYKISSPIKHNIRHEENNTESLQGKTTFQVNEEYRIYGGKSGKLELDKGFTDRYATPIQRLDGKWVIPFDDDFDQINTIEQFTIEDYSIDWFEEPE